VITETLSLNRLPEEIQERCRQADITSKSMLLQVVRQPSTQAMHRLIDRIARDGITREEARSFKRPSGASRRRRFTYRFAPEGGDYQFVVRFARPAVERAEVIEALQQVLNRLLEEELDTPEADPASPGDAMSGAEVDRGIREASSEAQPPRDA
jgi:ParB family chromosome partitioning protein